MGEIKNVATLTGDVQANISRSAIEFEASWMVLIYNKLGKDEIDPEPAIKRAIWKCGKIRGENYKTACVDPNDCRDSTNVFLNELGRKTSEEEIIEMKESEALADFHYCPLLAAWRKLGFGDEICALSCDVATGGDRSIAEDMGLQLDLTETLAEGYPICKLRSCK